MPGTVGAKQELMADGKPFNHFIIVLIIVFSAYCHSPRARRCCLVTGGVGAVFLLTGLLVLVAGPGMLEKKILQTMALAPGSDRLQSWLVPPVQAHLTGYGFHVTNPEEVMQGAKPILKEVGPFVYKAVTVKDSVDEETQKEHLEYNEDGETLTYRPR